VAWTRPYHGLKGQTGRKYAFQELGVVLNIYYA